MILAIFLSTVMLGQDAGKIQETAIAWKPLIAGDGGLKVLMPPDPEELVLTEKTGIGPVEIHGFRAEQAGITYLATYSNLTDRLNGTEYLKILNSPINRWIPDGRRRKALGERLFQGASAYHRLEDFSLNPREGEVKKIIRRRWMEKEGHFYQAIALMPADRAEAPEVARFLDSLETIPIEADARGLTPAWKLTRSKDEGFSALWPGRFDDGLIHVTQGRKTAGSVTFFVFERSMGYAIASIQYEAFSPLKPGEKQGKAAQYFDDARDLFLARYHAELTADRPIEAGGLVGREFEAKIKDDAKNPYPERKHPPGPGVSHIRGRLFSSGSHVYLIYVTAPPGLEADKGAETFLDSFRLIGN